jgi:hypothetical protein
MIDVSPVVFEQLAFDDLAAEGAPGGNMIFEALPMVATLFVLNVLPLKGFAAIGAFGLNVPPVTINVIITVAQADELSLSDGLSAIPTAHQRLYNTDRVKGKPASLKAYHRLIALRRAKRTAEIRIKSQSCFASRPRIGANRNQYPSISAARRRIPPEHSNLPPAHPGG